MQSSLLRVHAQEFVQEVKRRFGLPWYRVSFYGLSATAASLRKVAEALDLPRKRVERLISQEEGRTRQKLSSFLPVFAGKRALIVLGAGKVGPLSRVLCELGFEVLGAATVFGSPRDQEEISPYTDFLTDDPGDDELEKLVSFLKPDLVVSNAREVWRLVKMGYPTLSFPQERRRGPYSGYRGLVRVGL